MILPRRSRGEPLAALALILCSWVGGRSIAWENLGHGSPANSSGLGLAATVHTVDPSRPAAPVRPTAAVDKPDAGLENVEAGGAPPHARGGGLARLPKSASRRPIHISAPTGNPLARLAAGQVASRPIERTSKETADDRHVPPGADTFSLFPVESERRPGRRMAYAPANGARRWSGDSWLLVRGGATALAPRSLAGIYGASQAGAVLRYGIAPGDARQPAAYVRVTTALNGAREQEAAAGLSARPLARVPVVAMAEVRGLRDGAGTRLRPAVALVTQLAPKPLPYGFAAEVYGQAGYVGGSRPTAFADGLVRAERPLADIGGIAIHAGAGTWGAAQRGASRIDAGPVASLRFALGKHASARIEADWRFRLAGSARPGSGPALTLSAGF